MSYEDFLKIVKDYYILSGKFPDRNIKCVGSVYPRHINKYSSAENGEYIYFSVETGGYSGGNCWGDEAEHYSTSNDMEYTQLESILEEVCPSITFLQFKNILNMMESHDYTESEYYGNSTEYQVKTLSLKKLFQYLREKNLI